MPVKVPTELIRWFPQGLLASLAKIGAQEKGSDQASLPVKGLRLTLERGMTPFCFLLWLLASKAHAVVSFVHWLGIPLFSLHQEAGTTTNGAQ